MYFISNIKEKKNYYYCKKSMMSRLTCPFASCHQVAIAATIGSVVTISGHDFPTRLIPFYSPPRRVYSLPSVRQSENDCLIEPRYLRICIFIGKKNRVHFFVCFHEECVCQLDLKAVECCAKVIDVVKNWGGER